MPPWAVIWNLKSAPPLRRLSCPKRLAPGFDIVSDITDLRPTDTEGLKLLVRIQAAAKVKGARCVVRISRIPLSRLQFERMATQTGLAFEPALTLEEADARLDALGPAPAPDRQDG